MKRKVEQLKKIERLRKQLHELSAWRLAKVVHERERLVAEHAEMVVALGEGFLSYGAASLAGVRRVRRLEQEMSAAEEIEKDLEKRALDDGRLAKLAEGTLDAARETLRDKLERKGLEELIEASVAAGTGSRKP